MTDSTTNPDKTGISSTKIMDTLRDQLDSIGAMVDLQEASVVSEVGDGIARVTGLRTAMAGELLANLFPGLDEHAGRSFFGVAFVGTNAGWFELVALIMVRKSAPCNRKVRIFA